MIALPKRVGYSLLLLSGTGKVQGKLHPLAVRTRIFLLASRLTTRHLELQPTLLVTFPSPSAIRPLSGISGAS